MGRVMGEASLRTGQRNLGSGTSRFGWPIPPRGSGGQRRVELVIGRTPTFGLRKLLPSPTTLASGRRREWRGVPAIPRAPRVGTGLPIHLDLRADLRQRAGRDTGDEHPPRAT